MPVLWAHETFIMDIIIYTQGLCGFCDMAKREFERRGWNYTEYSINEGSLSENNKVSLMERFPEAKTVPQIWINDKHIGGYDDLMKWIENEWKYWYV